MFTSLIVSYKKNNKQQRIEEKAK